jgi:hypothetical protein
VTARERVRQIVRNGWFMLALTVLNLVVLGWTAYLHYGADVTVKGVPLKNCTSTTEPGKEVWTCHS